jgi:N-glycosidase YbiA
LSPDPPVRYFAPEQGYYEFCNFSPHGFELDGASWPTVEHYFQAQKFPGSAYQDTIRAAPTPAAAKALGQSRQHPLRPDWDRIKEEVMLRALRAKFAAPSLRARLLATGRRELVEDAEDDAYWARSRAGVGRNRAGELLMRVRAELQAQAEAGQAGARGPGGWRQAARRT